MPETSPTEANPPHPVQPEAFHPAFAWQRSEWIPALNLALEEYVHRTTGAVHYHLNSEHPENVFLVAFRTVPMDSTGVAHILEHTALCGSEKFPVRDPFFMMIRRSLNTFMNAFTSSDWTAYPFASQNKKDFYNLLSVYLDAVFFSRLHRLDFAQEGHRLEFAEPDNRESELLFKGVVYNEMKGSMSSINNVLWQTMSKYLFPTSTYHFNSGGEPDHIPDLSHEQLVRFHRSHYHPSNAVFMTFGNIAAFQHQQEFEELALSKFEKNDLRVEVSDEKRYLSPVRVEEFYPTEESDQDKTHVVVGWLLGCSTDFSGLFKAQLLSSVLLDNSASPLRKILETSSLGSAPSPLCGLENSNREMSFMAGLEGCPETATRDVEELVLNTLQEIAKDGVPIAQVEASLHQLELSQREISGDSFPYGLQLILAGLPTAVHRGDPVKLLDIGPVLAELREQIRDERFIPGLVQQLILDNPHRVTLTLKPDSGMAQRKIEAEMRQLAAIRASLSAEEADQIILRSRALEERQGQEDDPGILPKVGLEDIPKKITEPERIELPARSGAPLSFYGQGTNGLCYQQVVVQLPELDTELVDILPLYSGCLTEFGIGEQDYSQVKVWQAQVSGGISCFSSIRSRRDDVQDTHSVLTFSSRSLLNNHGAMSELVYRTLHEVRFDEDQRLRELIEQICARMESSIPGQGHSLAMNLASSGMSPAARIIHRFGGLEGIRSLKSLRERMAIPGQRNELLSRFQRLHRRILESEKQFLLIAEEEQRERVSRELESCWNGRRPGSLSSKLRLPATRTHVREAWTTSTQVNFCAKAYETVPSGHEDHAVLHVLAGFMRNGFLHRSIREQGGAYGGGAGQDANSASFRFFSYRDPRLEETLNDFDRAVDWVLSEKHPARQLEEAILGVIATMDKPSSPAGEAKQAFYNYLFGYTIEQRMGFRQRVLDTSLADLRRTAEKYLDPSRSSIGLITNRESQDCLDRLGLDHRSLEAGPE
ncbi:MAG: insulinase family protein [Gammaproteobacteria bacterium]|nr:insulinase family protein [Gammaproteobacteria bacterium]